MKTRPPKPTREITEEDIQRIKHCISRLFPIPHGGSVGTEDFIAAGLLGLVEASYEYDPRRKGWKILSKWRAIERARELLRWIVRTYANRLISYGAGDTTSLVREKTDLEYTPEEPEFENTEFIEWALGFVSGTARNKAARSLWLEGKRVEEIDLETKTRSTSSHIFAAREQVKLAIHNYCELEGLKSLMDNAGIAWSAEKTHKKRSLRRDSERKRRSKKA